MALQKDAGNRMDSKCKQYGSHVINKEAWSVWHSQDIKNMRCRGKQRGTQ